VAPAPCGSIIVGRRDEKHGREYGRDESRHKHLQSEVPSRAKSNTMLRGIGETPPCHGGSVLVGLAPPFATGDRSKGAQTF